MDRKKAFGRISKAMTVLLMLSFAQIGFPAGAAAVSSGSDTPSAVYDKQFVSERISNNYSKVSVRYTAKAYAGDDLVFSFDEYLRSGEGSTVDPDILQTVNDIVIPDTAVAFCADDTAQLDIFVPETALYTVDFDYLSCDDSVLPIEFSMAPDEDDNYPFYECRNVKLRSTWLPKAEKAYDRYNDEVVTVPEKAVQWENEYFADSSGRHSSPLLLQLEAGEHKLIFNIKSGNFNFGNMTLAASEMTSEYSGSTAAEESALITIEAENYYSVNESSLHAAAEFDAGVSPYKVTDSELNTIDPDSFDTAGQTIACKFNADTAGYYNIAINYCQSDNQYLANTIDNLLKKRACHRPYMAVSGGGEASRPARLL